MTANLAPQPAAQCVIPAACQVGGTELAELGVEEGDVFVFDGHIVREVAKLDGQGLHLVHGLPFPLWRSASRP